MAARSRGKLRPRFADDPTLLPLVLDPGSLADAIRTAIREFWTARRSARDAQAASGRGLDRGTRAEVTSGKAMNGFAKLFVRVLLGAGLPRSGIYVGSETEIPGYYRAEKDWDLLVVGSGKLIAALELKSQVGSFGNNFNNRVEEALGSAVDLRRAIDSGTLGESKGAWLGYLMLLQDDPKVHTPVKVRAPHFMVESGLKQASYKDRYVHLCRRLQSTNLYSSSALLLSPRGTSGDFLEPADDLSMERFLVALNTVASEAA